MEGDVKVLNNRDGEILSIKASHKFEEWFGIREIGVKIEKKAKEVHQDIQLDNLTRGSGNCFPIAVLQQLNRNTIHQKLDSNKANQIHVSSSKMTAFVLPMLMTAYSSLQISKLLIKQLSYFNKRILL